MEFILLINKIIVKIKAQIVKLRLRSKKDEALQGPPKSLMGKEFVLKKMKSVPFWFHHIDLGYGITAPGHQGDIHHPTGSKNLLENLKMPEDLSGKSVLDIGAWDGFFSFAAENRGAAKVLAIDNFYRGGELAETENQGFEVAKEVLASKVEFKKASCYDLNPQQFGMFDFVLFLGVFYHLKYPLLALEKIYSVVKDTLVMETHYDPYLSFKKPLAVFYRGQEINDDQTTWWGFNEAGLKAILQSVGFKNPKTLYKYADRIIIKANVKP